MFLGQIAEATKGANGTAETKKDGNDAKGIDPCVPSVLSVP